MSLLPSLTNKYSSLCCFFILLAIITGSFAYGQSRSGIVIGDSKPLNGATIKNLKLNMLAISGDEGAFTLKLNSGDTVVTSYLGFKSDTLIFYEQSSLLITLKPLTNKIGEVVIKGFKITPLEKFRKNQEDYKQIYRIGDDSHMFNALGGFGFAGFAISIDALYSHFSREGKNARKLQKTLVRDYYADIVDSRFTKSLVTKYTGYEGQQLDNFMIDNRPTYEFMKYASDYDVIKYIQQKAKENPSPATTGQNTK